MEKLNKFLNFAFIFILAVVFVSAGYAKLLRPDEFFNDILGYKIIHGNAALAASYFLPALEICAGLGLVFKSIQRTSAFIILILNAVFIAAIASAWARGLDINCGCFGDDSSSVENFAFYYLEVIIRDALFCIMALLILFSKKIIGKKHT